MKKQKYYFQFMRLFFISNFCFYRQQQSNERPTGTIACRSQERHNTYGNINFL